ncbi:oxidoreductase [Streptomyces humidus]|uniref:Oxidoreductase n=1 Tax=Streptomyces humidus TaxID=52259 RepID=A0A918L5C0_9ACTN|nr:aldo/keto reductase [Streptomyces humidus]GGS05402.1 oxidoreductase [Streptomyces humidus]
MRYRTLGERGPRVSAVGLGCLALTGGYGPVDRAECENTVRGALDLGVTLFDTADFYAGGTNEELVGRALAGRRDEAVIATRTGLRPRAPGGPPTVVDGRPHQLKRACEASLRRLDTDHIDVYYLGRVDPRVPVEESVGALGELVAEGKIRHVGLSEAPADDLRRAHAAHPVTVLESEYSVWERHVEQDALPAATAAGIGFAAHTPLGKGFLTGRLVDPGDLGPDDHRRNHPRFQGENFRANRRLVARAEEELAGLGMPLAQGALAWLLSRGPWIVPIPGTRSLRHLADNAAAADVRLTDGQTDRLTALLSPTLISGSRHPVRR